MKRTLAEANPDLVGEWHPTKNGELTPKDISYGSGKKVWWICSKNPDHIWEDTVTHRTSSKRGCPYHAGRRVSIDNSLAKLYPNIAAEWHPTKNQFKPTDFTAHSQKKVWWQCSKNPDHVWETTIANRTGSSNNKGRDCPFHSNQRVSRENCLAEINPSLAAEWHPTKNGKLTPCDVVAGSRKKVWWQCSKNPDHVWETTVDSRNSSKSGCPFHAGRKVAKDNNLSKLYPNIAKEWHPTKNKMKPTEIVAGSYKRVWWQCSKNPDHVWETAVSTRTILGCGCPLCTTATSKIELRIYSELIPIFGDVRHREKINNIECDIYLPNYKIVTQFDGAYWHKDKFGKDKKLTNLLTKEGFKVLRIREGNLKLINKSDISVRVGEPDIEIVLKLLSKIKSIIPMDSINLPKINNYLKQRKLSNSSYYEELINMLPGPLKGKSLGEKSYDLAREWNLEKNNISPFDISYGSERKVWWKCRKCGHEWQAIIYNRVNGRGCPKCSNKIVTEDNNLEALFPDLAKEWHPTKNKLKPSNVVPGSRERVWWQCSKDKRHEWQTTVSHRAIRGQGCPYHSGRLKLKSNI